MGLLFAVCVISQTQSQNYIKTRTMTHETDQSKFLDVIQYFDGLGRPVQTVQVGITPTQSNLVTLQEYDAYGRESATWLPAITTGNSGDFTGAEDLKSSSIASNQNDSKPYSKTVYEASPLNRVLEQYGPGAGWHNSNSSNKIAYLTNEATGNRSCINFKVNGNGLNTSLTKSGLYASGELYVTEMKDEKGNTSYEFKNKLDQVLLTRQINGNEPHDTYYVYDDYGNLSYVIPPILADKIIKENKPTLDSGIEVAQFAYLYKYDERNRCIRKRLPGCGWIYYVYDKADRLIFTQDAEQRKSGEWLYSIPDAFGRIVQTGICRNTDISNDNYKNKIVTGTHSTGAAYSLSNFTPVTGKVLTRNYYDNYNFLINRDPTTTNALEYEERPGYGKRYNANNYSAKGLLTGTYVGTDPINLGGSLDEYAALYYDDRGRLIQTKKCRLWGDGFDNEYIAYNFPGQPVKRLHEHLMLEGNLISELYSYEYDHAGRLKETKHSLNGGNDVTIAKNTYNELGQLASTQANNQSKLKIDYSYNIRSWITNVTNTMYREALDYDKIGNVISINDYKFARTGTEDWYLSIEYDGLSRIINYLDMAGGSPNAFFQYDKHGNIRSINRSSIPNGDYEESDDLVITHIGNQVKTVEDFAADDSNESYSYDFKDITGVGTSASYEYDLNGSMTKDPYKGIQISNNYLNLPKEITVNNPLTSGFINNVYLATGEKIMSTSSVSLRRSLNPSEIAGGISTMASTDRSEYTYYFGNIIYKMVDDEDLYVDKILIDNGYIKNGNYYFYIKDHLGNNKIVISSTGKTEHMDDYFPYGMPIKDTKWNRNPQTYRFGDKEFETLMGLNLYDFHARMHDPALGRFMSVDPMAEKYYSISPYAYCGNNPINAFDLNGDSIWYTINNNVATMHVTGKVINQSGDNINMKRAASDIASGITDAFSGAFKMNGQTYELQVDVKLEAVTSMNNVTESDHLFVFHDDDGISASGVTNMIGGKVINLAASDYANDNWFSNIFRSNNTQTAAHEFGHAAGLLHESASGQKNLMIQSGGGTNVTSGQRAMMIENQKSINRGPNSYMRQPYPYVHDYKTGQVYIAHRLLNWNTIYKR